MSDHQHIRFDLKTSETRFEGYRVPKSTNWDAYKEHLGGETEDFQTSIDSIEELDAASTQLQNAITKAYEVSCPERQKATTRDVPWWNKELAKLRVKVRRLFNRAKSLGHWEDYKTALSEYNKELRKAKRRTWRQLCEGITELAPAQRLQKVLSKEHSNGIGLIKKPNGGYTDNPKESLSVLLQTHFPGSKAVVENEQQSAHLEGVVHNPNRASKSLAGKIFTTQRIKWAIKSFKPFKSPGKDGIFPALLQHGLELIEPFLKRLFKASFIFGYIPKTWREAVVAFIPKTGRRPMDEPKSYRPISLTSFLLKAMEKIIDCYVRSELLELRPLHKKQFAYQAGKSTINALQCLIESIEKTYVAKEMALCAFIDIEGAFDNTSHASITRSLEERNINASLIRWTQSMLKSRIIVATLGGETVKMTAEKGCPQGGVLSPLLWSLVVDDLLVKLHESGFTTQGYADDLVVTIRGKHDGVISDRMQLALNIIRSWCAKEGLNVNPSKTVLVPFTKRRKYELKAPTLNGIQLTFSKEVKYLGVVIDHKLTWNSQINHILSRATAASWTCRRVFGKTWGLKPKMIYWSYQTIIKPMVTYASLVWWPKIQQISAQVKLQKVQRLACLGITGAIFTCPTAALEVMLNLPPLHVCVMKEAANSAFRLSQTKNLKAGNRIGHLKILEHISLEAMSKPTDFMPVRYDFEMQFEVVINSHQTCTENGPQLGRDASVWYTDGSKMDERVGVGVTGPNFRLSKPLGNTPTIFQAELHAIELCAQECLERGTRREKIYILSDSQAALKALRSYTCESKLTWDCKQSLRQLAENNQVTLMWVPGHRGIKGNEEADCLAKEGANTQFPGPEPFCGLSKAHLKEEFRRWETDEMKSHWNKVPGQRQAKRLVCLSPKKAKQLLELDKKDLKMVTGLLTGHCPLGYHLKKMGKSESDSCRYCENFAETAEHLLCECPALFCKRLKFLEGAFLTPSDIRKLAPRKLINFTRSLGIPGLE